ncbi:MAG: hypothetical protein ACPGR5_06700 [Chitinophagales bacterium]
MKNNINTLINPHQFILVWIFCLTFSSFSYAQEVEYATEKSVVKHNYEQIFKKRYWNFFIRPLMSIQKGVYYKDDNLLFRLNPAPGFQFGGMINFGLPKHFSIQTGLNIEVNYFSFMYRMEENYMFNNFLVDTKISWFNYMAYVLPIYAGYKIPFSNKKNNFFIETKLGFDLKFGGASLYSSESYSGVPGDPNTKLLVFLTNDWSNPKFGRNMQFTSSIVAAIGFNYILKDQRVINFQIIGSYNPFIVDKGTITFLPDTQQEKIIPFRNYFNTLGLEINYMFSKRPNHISKRKRKQMEALKGIN